MTKSFYLTLSAIVLFVGLYLLNQGGSVPQPGQATASARRGYEKNFSFPTPGADALGLQSDLDTALENFEDILALKNRPGESGGSLQSAEGTASAVLVDPRQGQGIDVQILQNNSGYDAAGGAVGRGSSELDALREAAALYGGNNGSSLIPGARVSGPDTPDDVLAAPVPTATATPQNEVKDVTGQARGYTMLYLMYPRARQTVERQIDAMIRSRVQQLYLGVLVDGTFGRDFNFLSNVVRRIAREKRSLVLVLYLSNGSTMRSEDSLAEAPFSNFTPEEFRQAIISNPAVRNQYLEIVRPVLPVLQLNRRLNSSNRNFVIPMLEDNLDDASYVAMRALAASVIGNRAVFMRNPHGTLAGSTVSGLGDPVESHIPSEIRQLKLEDGFSLDGVGYTLSSESTAPQLNFDDTKALAITASSQGLRYFGLWRHERQGLRVGEAPPPVSQRDFEVPTEADILREIEILRTGLTEVE